MIATTAQSASPPIRGRSPQAALATAFMRCMLIAAAYLAGVHLAAAAGDDPSGAGAGAALGPSCVGCHQGADDDPPEGGPEVAGPLGARSAPLALAAATRDELARRLDHARAPSRQEGSR